MKHFRMTVDLKSNLIDLRKRYNKPLNVVAHGAFIDKDAPIVVAEVHGNRIVVEILDKTTTPESGKKA